MQSGLVKQFSVCVRKLFTAEFAKTFLIVRFAQFVQIQEEKILLFVL